MKYSYDSLGSAVLCFSSIKHVKPVNPTVRNSSQQQCLTNIILLCILLQYQFLFTKHELQLVIFQYSTFRKGSISPSYEGTYPHQGTCLLMEEDDTVKNDKKLQVTSTV